MLPAFIPRRKFYHNKSHYGPVSGGGAAFSILGIELVVVTGLTRSRADEGMGLCSGGGNLLGGAGRRGGSVIY